MTLQSLAISIFPAVGDIYFNRIFKDRERGKIWQVKRTNLKKEVFINLLF